MTSTDSTSDLTPEPLQCGRFTLTFERPRVMGILNVTPDSFSDGGRYVARDEALRQAERMLGDGADIIDIGGESTRPGAPPVPLDEELARVIPIVEALRDVGVPLSLDTYKPEVMRAALAAGADLINDVWGFRRPGAVDAVRESRCGLCIMHMLGEPQTMQRGKPDYDDVVADVRAFLTERVEALMLAGIARGRLSVDPGFGFGKSTLEDNYALLAHLADTAPRVSRGVAPYPILAGMSRKSMFGVVTGRATPAERVAASVAGAVCAVERGAAIVRVHDVAETVDALKVWAAVREAARKDRS
ncbi:dihydropteroate synthase [Trinickia caryophylli]|uniref:Dihydropteroate synthase n=2 Tax=Trinickia caryophylli TaxID=28094 RepID=A0A1X7CMS6_TRICW|nr:dihydropteroate synthase [Trinickia caryophylli]PMS11215.1 dihydropteroate synthase [Trinickia caryophylli]TRX20070.1 dihydropteroate synthase [Trinickia caryophylli]WQE12582.1 dihydropteroate synthase [Trinickia caryophylli]SME99372.1 Dihydropteroate synthase [Trinickia caryophylli]GLU30275.1 dihydropteroate synthase [Trinickia caryophylli]